MLTLFAMPKAFRGHMELIQRNAISSWTVLRPQPEIILFGGDEGTGAAAKELNARYEPAVARNEFGTPLVDDLFGKAQELATYDIMCYVNADIVLTSNFAQAVQAVSAQMSRFLMVGRRWDLEITEPVDFTPDWEMKLLDRVSRLGRLHPPTGIDYFVFNRGLWGEIPPFAIGRSAWDNWLVYQARAVGAPVVDLTAAALVVHQSHDYGHVPSGADGVWKGPEAIRNKQLTGGRGHIYTIRDATHKLTPNGPQLTLTHKYFFSPLPIVPRLYSRLASLPTATKLLTAKYSRPLRSAWTKTRVL